MNMQEYFEFEKWLNHVLAYGLPDNTIGIGFNIYEDNNDEWAVQLIASDCFDANDSDWMCNEIFSSGEDLFYLYEKSDWEKILEKCKALVNEYLEKGKYSSLLKKYTAIGIGFVDGDVEILYINN